MAGVFQTFHVRDINTFHDGTGVFKTLLQIVAAANHRALIHEVAIGFRGIDPTAVPVIIDLVEQTSAGTGLSSVTGIKEDPSYSETLQTTALRGGLTDAANTAEPTTGTNYRRSWTRHAQSSLIYPLPMRTPIIVRGGERVGLRVKFINGSAGIYADLYALVEE